jgi:hypothetical protein|tara:strand:+ start:68 stop:304 length:237 start_codon:yes stop_codon:yes gene_type:complete
MSEQLSHVDHLKNLLIQKDELSKQYSELNEASQSTRDLLLKVQGAIEYLQQIGVELPQEESETEEETNTEEPEVEVAQ